MGVDAIGAAFIGLSAVITAVGGILATRATRVKSDTQELRNLRRRYRLAVRHIFRLEILLERNGIEVPDHPVGMDDEEDMATGA